MKRIANKKQALLGLTVLTSLLLVACNTGTQTGTVTTEPSSLAASEPASEEPIETQASQPPESMSESSPAADTTVSIPNPIQTADSPTAFASIGLKLDLPPNDQWYSDPVYSIIDGKIAQIQFYDEIIGSDATARCAKETEGDISGVYYVFDEKKEQTWSAWLEDESRVDIRIQITIDGADIHGVLATWTHDGITYTLWEDDAWEHPDGVAKMAIGIMNMVDTM